MSRRLVALFVSLLLLGAAPGGPSEPAGTAPRPAPGQYMTGAYGLTFAVPAGASYCPLPGDWIGSDHGTTIFLELPRSCGGAGYPSSSRGYEPAGAARLELYYSYWMGEDEPPPRACRRVGTIGFLGAARPVCEEREGGLVRRSVTARYMADIEAEAVLSLVTRPGRLAADMAAFAAAASSMRTCTAAFRNEDGSSFTIGTGALCPEAASWF